MKKYICPSIEISYAPVERLLNTDSDPYQDPKEIGTNEIKFDEDEDNGSGNSKGSLWSN